MAGVQHATRPLLTPEFTRRAACAWIRAADAGLIDAAELAWLLSHLPGDPPRTGVRAKEC
ncbi:MAG: hypothetical protein QOI78_183 [Actinomycetota bacterium]|jgi:hypothetical protein|nr:hypothetical protein [Actinomycetota bacterium]